MPDRFRSLKSTNNSYKMKLIVYFNLVFFVKSMNQNGLHLPFVCPKKEWNNPICQWFSPSQSICNMASLSTPINSWDTLYHGWILLLYISGLLLYTLDINMGYWTVKLDYESQRLCTIILPWGKICLWFTFQWVSMLHPDVFQERMQGLFDDMSTTVKVYLDDLVILTAWIVPWPFMWSA